MPRQRHRRWPWAVPGAVIAFAGGVTFLGTLLIAGLVMVKPSYTAQGAVPALRWGAYRDWLWSLGRPVPGAAPPAPSTPAQFDEQLAYAVALGASGPVVAAGRALAPDHPVRSSPLFWYGMGGPFHGHSPIDSLSSSVGQSMAPAASSGSGFSGGGSSGGSSGGGGGGAW